MPRGQNQSPTHSWRSVRSVLPVSSRRRQTRESPAARCRRSSLQMLWNSEPLQSLARPGQARCPRCSAAEATDPSGRGPDPVRRQAGSLDAESRGSRLQSSDGEVESCLSQRGLAPRPPLRPVAANRVARSAVLTKVVKARIRLSTLICPSASPRPESRNW